MYTLKKKIEGRRRGFDMPKRFNIGIDTINRHDCWTFIIACQIIFCTNLHIILQYSEDVNCYHRVLLCNSVRILFRIDPPHPLVCHTRRLNGVVLQMRPEKPRPCVTIGVARYNLIKIQISHIAYSAVRYMRDLYFNQIGHDKDSSLLKDAEHRPNFLEWWQVKNSWAGHKTLNNQSINLLCTLLFSETFMVWKGIACSLWFFQWPLTTRVYATRLYLLNRPNNI
jgi:hypothetical protein